MVALTALVASAYPFRWRILLLRLAIQLLVLAVHFLFDVMNSTELEQLRCGAYTALLSIET